MKYFLILLLYSALGHSTTIGQYVSHPDGSSFQSFVFEKNKILYEKHSNYFDQKKDLSLGHFELNTKQDMSGVEKKLKDILAKIEEVDDFLKKKNTSFNELSSKKAHQSFLLVNKYRITKESDLYPELKKIYHDLYKKDWKQISGIQLSDDLKKVISIEEGKKVSEKRFNMSFHCKKAVAPTVCGYKDLGILYIQ